MNKNDHNVRKIIYWTTTIMLALVFFVTGMGNILHITHIAHDMAHLGYPPYFLNILGYWKILAALVIIVPGFKRAKEWAYAGMIFDLTGAAFSRYAMNDNMRMIIVPLGIATLVVVNYWVRSTIRFQIERS